MLTYGGYVIIPHFSFFIKSWPLWGRHMPGINHLSQIRQSRLEVIHALADELLKQLKELSHFGLALFAWSAPEAIGNAWIYGGYLRHQGKEVCFIMHIYETMPIWVKRVMLEIRGVHGIPTFNVNVRIYITWYQSNTRFTATTIA